MLQNMAYRPTVYKTWASTIWRKENFHVILFPTKITGPEHCASSETKLIHWLSDVAGRMKHSVSRIIRRQDNPAFNRRYF